MALSFLMMRPPCDWTDSDGGVFAGCALERPRIAGARADRIKS
jgi:hypothetical protein